MLPKLVNVLEQRQYKNDSIQSELIPILNLARFFSHCLGGEKERQFQSWNYFLTEWSRSYIVFALKNLQKLHE